MKNDFQPGIQILRSIEMHRYCIAIFPRNIDGNTSMCLNTSGFSPEDSFGNLIVIPAFNDDFYAVRRQPPLVRIICIILMLSIIVLERSADLAMYDCRNSMSDSCNLP